MNKTIISIATIATIGIIGIICIAMYFSYSNTEISLRNRFNAVQTNNKNEFDLMWKKIGQTAQISKAERASVEKIIVGYAGSRSGNAESGKGAFINAVKEAIPSISDKAFTNLQNIVVSSRDRFAANQTKLIDIKREHDNVRTLFPGSLVCGSRPELEIVLVTSSRTDDAFETGQDNNVDLDL